MSAFDWFLLLTFGTTAIVFAALAIVGLVLYLFHVFKSWITEGRPDW